MHLPPYPIFPVITGETISLRNIIPADIKDLVEISFYNAIQASSLEEATEMQSRISQDYQNGNTIHWGIFVNKTNKIAGTCGYYRGFDNRTGELGFVLKPHYRGNGIMTSALRLAIDFGRNTIGLQRIHAITTLQNISAIKVLERCNFKRGAGLGDDEIEYEMRF
jgi:ribosomal-protein-alanine N-acetyltransferase